MKRSKSIDLNRMRKKRILQLGSLSAVAGGATLLTGCGNDDVDIDATVYRNLDTCKSLNYGNEQLCVIAYRQALRYSEENYPRYTKEEYCLEEFKRCHIKTTVYGIEYTPDIAGFLLAQISPAETSDACYRTRSFGYKGACYSSKLVYEGNDVLSHNYYTADGDSISFLYDVEKNSSYSGDTKVIEDVFSTKHKYKYKKPLGRGGFGKRVAALTSSKSSRINFTFTLGS